MPELKLKLGESFKENFPYLSDPAKSEVFEIGNRLVADPRYVPDSMDFPPLHPQSEDEERAYFTTERFYTDGIYRGAICTKLRDWDDWYLVWHFQYEAGYRIGAIWLNLTNEPEAGKNPVPPVTRAIEGIRILLGLGG